MRNINIHIRNLVLAAAVAFTVSACVVEPARGYYAGGGYYTGAVTIAPPAPQVEVYGAPPVAGYVWLGGYWNWVGNRHVWVEGRWSAPRVGIPLGATSLGTPRRRLAHDWRCLGSSLIRSCPFGTVPPRVR